MHDHSTRASHRRHRNSAWTAAVLVAAFLCALPCPGPSLASSPAVSDTLARAPDVRLNEADGNVAHDIAITTVAPGREGLDLQARLVEGGGFIERPIKWRVSDASGGTVFDGETPQADLSVPPGDYAVDIRYGAAHYARTITLLPGNRLGVNFVLNVGGVRILPQVRGLGPTAAPAHMRVFALSGLGHGQLVAETAVPGEILRVPAGDYRIESCFEPGNAVAVTDVTVKAGRLRAVQIDHAAGLARLAFVGAPDAAVDWKVEDSTGLALAHVSGLNATVVLKPGTYTARAATGRETLTATFAITEGEARDIILGN